MSIETRLNEGEWFDRWTMIWRFGIEAGFYLFYSIWSLEENWLKVRYNDKQLWNESINIFHEVVHIVFYVWYPILGIGHIYLLGISNHLVVLFFVSLFLFQLFLRHYLLSPLRWFWFNCYSLRYFLLWRLGLLRLELGFGTMLEEACIDWQDILFLEHNFVYWIFLHLITC